MTTATKDEGILTREQLIEELAKLGVQVAKPDEALLENVRAKRLNEWSNREHRYGSKKCEETPHGPFRVLRGTHSEGYEVDGTKLEPLRFYRGGPYGDILYSRLDLVQRLNSPGSEKFALVHESEKPITSKDVNEQNARLEGLDNMSKAELIRFAEEEEINLEGATTKDQIVKRIKDAL